MKRILKVLTVFMMAVLLTFANTNVSLANDFSKGTVERLHGNNRIDTSIEISKKVYPNGANTVILVGYDGSVDALAGTALASAKDAPVIMVNQNRLTESTDKEITRLKAKNIYILGSESVVSTTVENALKSKGLIVKRLGGNNRLDTTINIAKEIKPTNVDSVFLVAGWPSAGSNSLADALAIGPVSGMLKQPILLTNSKTLSQETKQALQDLNVENVTIIGGIQPVSKEIETELSKKYNVKRIEGSNRENTSLEIQRQYFKSTNKVIIANGYDSTDALLGGYMGSKFKNPIIFTNTNRISESTSNYLFNSNLIGGYILGGENVITNEIKEIIMNNIMKVKLSNAKKPINVETPKPYESMSGQTTHPDVTYIEKGWNGHKYWMAHTPYHNTDEDNENPAVSYSDDGINFKTYKGATNPIDDPKFGLVDEKAHMSDTDMLIKPDGTMEVYYRYRDRAKGKGEIIYRKTSKDAVNWTDREVVMKGFDDSGTNLLSPALIYENGSYRMWWVERTTVYTSTSKTGSQGTWAAKTKVNLNYDGKALTPWHLDVFKDNGEYYLVLNANEAGVTSRRSLAIGKSKDGLSFSNIKTIMRPTVSSWDNWDIYRGSIVKVGNTYKLYYSAMGKDRRWFVGLSESADLLCWKGK